VPVVAGEHATIVVAESPDARVAIVPTWRRDIEIEADLAEEVARVRGYERVPATLPDTVPPPWRPNPLEVRQAVRDTLVGAGLAEVVTHALVSAGDVERYRWSIPDEPAEGEARREGDPIAVTNPLSQDHAFLRQSLVGSLAAIADANVRRGTEDVSIFEVGKGYGHLGDEPREWWRLGIALAGRFESSAWNRPGRVADVDDAKGLVERLVDLVGGSAAGAALAYEALTDEPLLHPGRSARVTAGSVLRGVVGELHPRLLADADLRLDRLVVAELSIAGLSGGTLPTIEAVAPPRFPVVERDLAVVVGPQVAAAAVLAAVRVAAGPGLADARLFDVYRGRPLADDERSLAVRLRFVAPERTLTESEVEAAVADVVMALERGLAARLRT
jgi:phenylalanyl-tRNA synthetase beta chain